MNKYEIDVHEEETAVELFAKNIMYAGQIFWSHQWSHLIFLPGAE